MVVLVCTGSTLDRCVVLGPSSILTAAALLIAPTVTPDSHEPVCQSMTAKLGYLVILLRYFSRFAGSSIEIIRTW
jgi:hypothetical protein